MSSPDSLSDLARVHGLLYGGDYNPDQWPEAVWLEDARLMQAAGVNCVSLAIFSWARLEPRPGVYDFEWLDRVIDTLYAHGVRVALATATASPPPWFTRAHPESLPVDAAGRRWKPGSRQHYCPNSAAYRAAAAGLAGRLAARYHQHPAVILWHANNEYGCHNHSCYCETCTAQFRVWLRARYGTLEALNAAWGTAFWSQAFADWDEIELPNRTITFRNPGQALDYRRFMNASILAIFDAEAAAVRAAGAVQPITTNLIAGLNAMDLFEWGAHADFCAHDLYIDPALKETAWREAALAHDLARGAGAGNFLLMEQTTTQVNWRAINQLKRPGMMRAFSHQALARGAEGVMFFQWRASRAGAEKFHAGLVPHFGVEDSRVFAEVCQLGAELKQLRALAGTRRPAAIACLVSYPNLWALELESKPAQLEGWDMVRPWHAALVGQNLAVDLVTPDADLAPYKLVVAPALYQLTQAQAEKLRAYVAGGGRLVLTYFSGVVDEREHIWLGGYPALLQDVLGIKVEEWQPFQPGETNILNFPGARAAVPCTHWADLLHATTAEVLATFGQDFYAGRPALTRNAFGQGEAWYCATRPAPDFMARFLGAAAAAAGVQPVVRAPAEVEAGLRVGAGGQFLFLINHGPETARVDLEGRRGVDLLTSQPAGPVVDLAPDAVQIIALAE